jgi:hypothetical protein
MHTKFFVALLMTISTALGAAWDATGLVVLSDGGQVETRISAGSTGQAYVFGWNTNGVAALPKVTLTVNTPRRFRDGSTGVITRAFYGTARVRQVHPNHALADERTDAGDTLVKFYLDKRIRNLDVITQARFESGWYGSANATTLTTSITNNSTIGYKKPIVNVSEKPNTRLRSTTPTFHFVGGHHNGIDSPLALIHCILTDESGDTVSNIVTQLNVDWTNWSGYGLPQAEYLWQPDISSLTQGDVLTLRYIAYAHLGDAYFDSQADALPEPAGPRVTPGNATFLYQPNAYAGVAAVGTVGATPTVYPDGTDPATIPSNHYYGSGNAAGTACQTYNNANYGHNDAGGSVIYLRSTETAILESSVNLGSMETYLTFQEYPGDSVVLNVAGGSSSGSSDKIEVVGCEVALAGNTTAFSGMDELSFDRCHLNTSGNGPWQNVKVIHGSRNTFGLWSGGLIFFAGQNTAIGVWRQNNFNGMNGRVIAPQVWLGNICTSPGGTSFRIATDDSSWPASLPGPDRQIHWGNFIKSTATFPLTHVGAKRLTNGFLAVNCHYVGTDPNTQSGALANLTGIPSANSWLINCAFVDIRNQYYYSGHPGTSPEYRDDCISVNCIFTVQGEATDIDILGNNGARGGPLSDWLCRWRVDHFGNINWIIAGGPTHGDPEFVGRNSYRPLPGNFTPSTYPKFRNTAGFDYVIKSEGGMHDNAYKLRRVLTHDLYAKPRGNLDPPGAVVGGEKRKGFL